MKRDYMVNLHSFIVNAKNMKEAIKMAEVIIDYNQVEIDNIKLIEDVQFERFSK